MKRTAYHREYYWRNAPRRRAQRVASKRTAKVRRIMRQLGAPA